MKNTKSSKLFSLVAAAMVACGCLSGCNSSANAPSVNTSSSKLAESTTAASAAGSYSDTITLVWYPNECAEDYDGARAEVGRLVEQATGKKVEQKMTTDYSITIESLASGTAQVACVMGAQGYIEAKNKNDAVQLLFVNSGESGTLDDALYYSFMAVNSDDSAGYKSGDSFSIDNIVGKKMSFVSNSSTSGFKVPTNSIISHFSSNSKWSSLDADALIEGGSDMFFSEVLFGGSHQGSAYNLMSGKSDISAFCNTEIAPYADCVSGTENETGAVYQIKSDAAAPFDTVTGKQFTIIQSIPVLNGPWAYNSETLSPEDAAAIQALFTSDEVANNDKIFIPEGSENVGLYKKTYKEHFVTVDDSWYDAIRNLSK
jgi:phosphonate transport system substrate-binding protein